MARAYLHANTSNPLLSRSSGQATYMETHCNSHVQVQQSETTWVQISSLQDAFCISIDIQISPKITLNAL